MEQMSCIRGKIKLRRQPPDKFLSSTRESALPTRVSAAGTMACSAPSQEPVRGAWLPQGGGLQLGSQACVRRSQCSVEEAPSSLPNVTGRHECDLGFGLED